MTTPRTIDENTANGQSNGEYATVILRICGIEENWTWDEEKKRWGTDRFEMRTELEKLMQLAKLRVIKNVKEHMHAEQAVENFGRILDANE